MAGLWAGAEAGACASGAGAEVCTGADVVVFWGGAGVVSGAEAGAAGCWGFSGFGCWAWAARVRANKAHGTTMARQCGAAWASRERPGAINMEGAFKAHFIRVSIALCRSFATNNTQVAGLDTRPGIIFFSDFAGAARECGGRGRGCGGYRARWERAGARADAGRGGWRPAWCAGSNRRRAWFLQ